MNEQIKQELLALQNDDGVIVPETVLDWARRHTKSATHAAIDWDTDYNANIGLLHQVRRLIVLNVRIEPQETAVYSLSIDRQENGGYRQKEVVLETPRLRAILLRDALRELELLEQRFEELEELSIVWEAAKEVARRAATRGRRRRRDEAEPRPSV